MLQLTSPSGKLEVPEIIPHRQRTRYYGSNIGDSIGYISLTPWNTCWTKTFDQKKKMLGTKRREVGGKVDAQAPRERLGSDMEPVSYTSMPQECYDELCDELAIQGSIDFDAADGLNALCHIEGQRQYTGVTWTTTHSTLLMEHLVDQVFFRMTSLEKSRLFDPTLASIIGNAKVETRIKRKAKLPEEGSIPKKTRTPKKTEEGNTADGEPGAVVAAKKTEEGKTPKVEIDKKMDLLNLLKTLKKPGTSAGGSDDIQIEHVDDDEVSEDEE